MDRDELRRRKRRTYVGGGLSDSLLPLGYVAEEEDGVITFTAVLGGGISFTELEGIITFTKGATESNGVITL